MKSPKSSGKPKKINKSPDGSPRISKPKLPKVSMPIMVRRIVGHSMLPVLPPGTLVVARKWFFKPRVGQVVILLHDNKEKIKRIDKLEKNRVFVLGDHPEASTDSRQFGWLPASCLVASVIWPKAKRTSI